MTIERNTLRFSAAHFATFGGDCEPLHGHNYDVFVELEGGLTDDAWVFDFVTLKRIVAGLCDQLDHRFLLPVDNPHLRVREDEKAYEIAFADRRYVVPKADVAALPIDNSTAERLAEWLCGRLASELRARNASNLESITIAVEEAPGQAGWYTARLDRGE
ncbi:MAG: 6-pyruvoyl tetrahydropterin synthase family protein [Chloroflexi bacterium]|nr:6-pyruvoyl tetrahydropterin synthase family protein [Chloroflexota bacterium]